MNKMKTLTLQGIPFEVVDGQARNDVEVLKESGWNELKDKPFGEDKAFEPISFVLDGNYDDVETFTMPNGQVWVKLYNKYVQKEAIESLSLTFNGTTETITSDSITEHGYGWIASIFASADDSEAGELPEGIWVMDAFKIVQTSVTANINPKVTLTKLDKKYLPDDIGGGGADWSQNDPNAPDYVKGRTHWTEEGISLSWDGNKDGRDVCFVNLDFGIYLYKVTDKYFDAQTLTDAYIVGSKYTLGTTDYVMDVTEDVGVPCAICVHSRYSAVISIAEPVNISDYIVAPSAGTYLADLSGYYGWDDVNETDVEIGYVKLVTTNGIVHKLDKRFLPDDVVCGTIVKLDTLDNSVTCSGEFSDVWAEIETKGMSAINLQLFWGGNPRTILATNWHGNSLELHYFEPGDDLKYNCAILNSDGTMEVVRNGIVTITTTPA